MSALIRVLCLLLLLMQGGFLSAGADPALTTCAEIRGLAREVADRRRPVRVRGVVTFSFPGGFTGFTFQDGTCGIYVDRAYSRDNDLLTPGGSWPETITRGMELEIRGVTWSGHFAPVLCPQEIRVLGTAPLPEATPIGLADVLDGKWDCQRARLRGVVQFAENSPDAPEKGRFDLVGHGGRIRVYSLAPLVDPARLVDSEVEVSGVVFTYFNNRGELVGARLQTENSGDWNITRRGPTNPFDAVEVPLATLRPFSPSGLTFHRRRLTGTVTLAQPGQFFYLQHEGRGIRVETRDSVALSPGDEVEASGFVAVAEHFGKLGEAVIRKVGKTSRPAPLPMRRSRVLGTAETANVTNADDTDGIFARLRGRLENVDMANSEAPRLLVESEGHLVTAVLVRKETPARLADFEPGCELQIDGVIRVELAAGWPASAYPTPISYQLLVHDAEDLVLLRKAEWWTPRRLWLLLGGVGGALTVALGWNWLLRRRVEQRSAQLTAAMRARRDAEVEFDATLRERERLAADLHDSLEQLLTSVALQLEAGDALREEAPEQSTTHAHLATQLLSRSREELRRSIWNLRALSMVDRTLPEALQDMVTTINLASATQIAVHIHGVTRLVPDFIAGNLLLLVQESVTNSLKHSGAGRIRVLAEFREIDLRICVEDDGQGFDPSNHPGPREGHFGLQGMHERIKRIGGKLELTSSRGEGTCVVAIVPLEAT